MIMINLSLSQLSALLENANREKALPKNEHLSSTIRISVIKPSTTHTGECEIFAELLSSYAEINSYSISDQNI